MKYVYVGEIVNTHGIKGEVRIISDFKQKALVFLPGMKVYVGKRKDELILRSYRVHKQYDMVTFVGIENINEVIMYKGDSLYIQRDDLNYDGYLDEDLIGMEVREKDHCIGTVEYIMKSKAHDILVVSNGKYKNMIPNIDLYVKQVDVENKIIEIESVKGLIHED